MTVTPELAPALPIDEVAEALAVPPQQVREWLMTFSWERRYDGAGHLLLAPRDVEFLRLVKSLRAIDRTCESITRLLDADAPRAGDDEPEPEVAEDADEPADLPEDALSQIETLKAELRDLHAKPARKPFWKFWQR